MIMNMNMNNAVLVLPLAFVFILILSIPISAAVVHGFYLSGIVHSDNNLRNQKLKLDNVTYPAVIKNSLSDNNLTIKQNKEDGRIVIYGKLFTYPKPGETNMSDVQIGLDLVHVKSSNNNNTLTQDFTGYAEINNQHISDIKAKTETNKLTNNTIITFYS